jgi:uncharacterized coiled-coil protein SlyX
MEARVRVLETHIGYIKDGVAELQATLATVRNDTSTLKVDMATLKERVAHLPGKGFIVTAATGGVAAIVALLTLLARFGFLVAT